MLCKQRKRRSKNGCRSGALEAERHASAGRDFRQHMRVRHANEREGYEGVTGVPACCDMKNGYRLVLGRTTSGRAIPPFFISFPFQTNTCVLECFEFFFHFKFPNCFLLFPFYY